MNTLSLKKPILLVSLVLMLSACSVFNLPFGRLPFIELPAEQEEAATEIVQLPKEQEIPQASTSGNIFPDEQIYINLYKQVNPSVVHIRVIEDRTNTEATPQVPFPGFPQFPQDNIPRQGVGSGFVYDTNGHIVTNNHVVEGAGKILVTFYDGTEAIAMVVGTDPSSDTAVVKVEARKELLKPAVIGDSDAIEVGQFVVAIGNPFGLQNSMSTGIVSGLGRLLPTSISSQGLATYSIPDMIQTDAAINPGNSGGPLLNLKGEVIGMNTAIESPVRASSGVGYAIPSVIVDKIVPQLIRDGKATHAWLGIAGTTLRSDVAMAMDLDADTRGVLVNEIVKDSPADKAGLQGSSKEIMIDGVETLVGGDVIVGIDDKDVKVFDDLLGYIIKYKNVGDTVILHVFRGGEKIEVSLTLAARPASS